MHMAVPLSGNSSGKNLLERERERGAVGKSKGVEIDTGRGKKKKEPEAEATGETCSYIYLADSTL